jgi:hypothetical protein
VFAAVFFVFWLVRPDLRAWIERPKYRFLSNVQSYDQRRHRDSVSKGSKPA